MRDGFCSGQQNNYQMSVSSSICHFDVRHLVLPANIVVNTVIGWLQRIQVSKQNWSIVENSGIKAKLADCTKFRFQSKTTKPKVYLHFSGHENLLCHQ